MTITRFSFPTEIHFGDGARRLVAGHLREAGLRRPLIVTDRALAALPVMAGPRRPWGSPPPCWDAFFIWDRDWTSSCSWDIISATASWTTTQQNTQQNTQLKQRCKPRFSDADRRRRVNGW